MYQVIFNNDQINSQDLLQYFINGQGCKVKLENQSPYAVDIFQGTRHVDRLNPYSYSVLLNGDYNIKVNKDIKSTNEQSYNYISFKTYNSTTPEPAGSTTFGGTMNVSGDMNIIGGQVDAYVQGDVKLAPDTTVNANITGPVEVTGDLNLAPGAEVNATITGDINLSPGTEVNATIQNAQISTDIMNAKLATNEMVNCGSVMLTYVKNAQDKTTAKDTQNYSLDFELGLYDNFVFYITAYSIWSGDGGIQHYQAVVKTHTVSNTYSGGKLKTLNTLGLGSLRQPVENYDDFYCMANAYLQREEPVSGFDGTITLDPSWNTSPNGTGTMTCYCTLTVYAYNADPAADSANKEINWFYTCPSGANYLYTDTISNTNWNKGVIIFTVSGSGTYSVDWKIRTTNGMLNGELFNISGFNKGTTYQIQVGPGFANGANLPNTSFNQSLNTVFPYSSQALISGLATGDTVRCSVYLFN